MLSAKFDAIRQQLDEITPLVAALESGSELPPFGDWFWPTDYRTVTQPYGDPTDYGTHEGVDIRAPTGTPIYTVQSGVVTQVLDNWPYGKQVRIAHDQHAGNHDTLYAHMQSQSVAAGERVNRGRILGLADETGNSQGSHLHLNLYRNGMLIDPTPFLAPLLATLPAIGDPGVDVSHWQSVIDWWKVAASGIKFAWIKASEGASFRDPRFAANWRGAKEAGILRGAYHFFRPGSAVAQADHFLGVMAGDYGELPPALDVEVTGLTQAAMQQWLDRVEATTGKRPCIYTSKGAWAAIGNPPMGQYPLWLASYASQPVFPAGWAAFLAWQYSSTGQVDGIDDDTVDLNRWGTAS